MTLQATNSELYSASNRLVDDRQPSDGFGNDIAGSSHGLNELCGAGLVDLLAQTADVNVDQVGARIEVVAPDFLKNHHSGDDLSAVAHQKLKQLEFGGQQDQRLAAATRFPGNQVQFQVGNLQYRLGGTDRVAASQQHLDACGHLIRREGFWQIVIPSGTQAANALVHVGEGADHQDWRGNALGAQVGDDGQTIHLRQHAVQGNKVIITTHCTRQAVTAIVDPVHFQPVAAEFGHDFLCSDGIIFDCQNSGHGPCLNRCVQRVILPLKSAAFPERKFNDRDHISRFAAESSSLSFCAFSRRSFSSLFLRSRSIFSVVSFSLRICAWLIKAKIKLPPMMLPASVGPAKANQKSFQPSSPANTR
ncbi:Transcriptional regulator [Pseudomonas syringae pv. aptata]|uniref:Transcriptional regulator n=1 Tax=Pseudomonas syringae pv. aptata TaxID=83167 RepID=A0A3M5WL84_PSEAP|nr:Transcriptional regulator [Pseudomonas syringae pv. aptata]